MTATALKELLPPAKAGDPDAQLSLGLMYAKGQGVPQDPAEAVKWFRLVADRGQIADNVLWSLGFPRAKEDYGAISG